MPDEDIKEAIAQLSDPELHFRVLLASTPGVRRNIIKSLSEVQKLIDAGPEAGSAILEFFQRDETQSSDVMVGIALYLLGRLPTKEAVKPLATYINSGKGSILNKELAAQAFIANTGIEIDNEDVVTVANREAEKYL